MPALIWTLIAFIAAVEILRAIAIEADIQADRVRRALRAKKNKIRRLAGLLR